MDNNRIHQITSELKNPRNLISLNLSHNRLIEIPLQVLDLQQLENLNLEANIRHSVESNLGKLLTDLWRTDRIRIKTSRNCQKGS